MKKVILLLSAILVLTACSSSSDNEDAENKAKNGAGYPDQLKTSDTTIDSLQVGSCDELFNEMKAQYADQTDDELYSAAAVILFGDDRSDEGNACCENIKDPNQAQECKKTQ